MVLAPDTRVLALNQAGKDLLGDPTEQPDLTCCELFGCRRPGSPLAGGCLTELALESEGPLPEIRLDLGDESPTGAVWVTAAALRGDWTRVVVHLRAGDPHDRRRRTAPHWTADAQLHIVALGRTRVYSNEGALGGAWLNHRPGQLLKYLICQRHRPGIVHAEEIAEE